MKQNLVIHTLLRVKKWVKWKVWLQHDKGKDLQKKFKLVWKKSLIVFRGGTTHAQVEVEGLGITEEFCTYEKRCRGWSEGQNEKNVEVQPKTTVFFRLPGCKILLSVHDSCCAPGNSQGVPVVGLITLHTFFSVTVNFFFFVGVKFSFIFKITVNICLLVGLCHCVIYYDNFEYIVLCSSI